MKMNIVKYPASGSFPKAKVTKGSSFPTENPAIHIFGNRFYHDQTIYEYLIEFLLIFASAKDENQHEKFSFHTSDPTYYYVEPRVAFRRFVFLEKAKKSGRLPEDYNAYQNLKAMLYEKIEATTETEKETFLLALQDLFYGYAAVLKKRSWCAQGLLPLCPEMICCEQLPNEVERKKVVKAMESGEKSLVDFDTSFDLTHHDFLARGGEMYYLHLLQILEHDSSKRQQLESLLTHLLCSKSQQLSSIANWVQTTWEENNNFDSSKMVKRMHIGCIPNGAYISSGTSAVDELLNFLSNELHPVKRVDLLAKGMMFQIMRMISERTAESLNAPVIPWIIDMRATKGNDTIKKIATQNFAQVYDQITDTINTHNNLLNSAATPDKRYSLCSDAKKDSCDIFKGKGKELLCIIPSNGANERFSLSEDILRFLVLSIIKPGQKMDLNMFLEELYAHFHLVIGPNEYKKTIKTDSLDPELINSFHHNKDAFQQFLKATGFLRDLSDATSIVENPYREVSLP
ncbi:hypothetical protein RFF05_12685 [Bengtsoniella intestinalis]|uniref:hypothetical protein n=1 Tax=Bengtsoniella intestinalis TaxID=3073143 RepID=UPI00391F1BE1